MREEIRGSAGASGSGMGPIASQLSTPHDPRDPHPTRTGIFRSHNCWKCDSGEKPCPFKPPGREYLCEYPHARND